MLNFCKKNKRPAPVTLLKTTDSTNTGLKAMAKAGAVHGTVLAALEQTGGRGRLGRSFASPEGGLYMSILWRPALKPEQAAKLSCAGALAVCAAVENFCGVTPLIKWPNDLLLDGKKLCGILCEGSWSESGGYVVLGLGINVNTVTFPSELADKAVSLSQYTGKSFDIKALLEEIVCRLDMVYDNWGSDGAAFIDEYRRRCVTIGRYVTVDHLGKRLKAHALSISDNYGLLLQWSDGTIEEKSFGEILQLE